MHRHREETRDCLHNEMRLQFFSVMNYRVFYKYASHEGVSFSDPQKWNADIILEISVCSPLLQNGKMDFLFLTMKSLGVLFDGIASFPSWWRETVLVPHTQMLPPEDYYFVPTSLIMHGNFNIDNFLCCHLFDKIYARQCKMCIHSFTCLWRSV